MSTLYVSNNLFFQNIEQELAEGKKVKIRARGNSMLPFIRNATDNIVLQSVTKPLKEGMIVLAKTEEGNFVIHRIEKIYNDKIILRGDGNLRSRESCLPQNIIAFIPTIIRGSKKIDEGSFYWQLYRYICPRNPFLRRVFLAIYRRLALK